MTGLVMRQPPRCHDCLHAVGPTGDHVYLGRDSVEKNTEWIVCRECKDGRRHLLSMKYRYHGCWEVDFARWRARLGWA